MAYSPQRHTESDRTEVTKQQQHLVKIPMLLVASLVKRREGNTVLNELCLQISGAYTELKLRIGIYYHQLKN